MTEKELIDLGKSRVKNDEHLLALFQGFFLESFGREASCTGCTGFKDFDLLREKHYPTKSTITMRLTKYKVLYSREKILAYLKNGKVYRSRVSTLTDAFLAEFLKHASSKVYPNRDKMVNLLEKEKPEPKKPVPAQKSNPENAAEITEKPAKRKRRSSKKKKDE